MGFSHFAGAGTATVSFGRHNGLYTAERPNYYLDLLDDAKQIHVILQDMTERRAWQTNGESAILQIILHRHAMGKYTIGGKLVNLSKASIGDASSIRRAMVQNANIEVARDQHMKEDTIRTKLFREVVGEFYAILEGLEGHSEEVATAGIELRMDWRRRISGYEYMELFHRKHRLQSKEVALHKTCGRWPDYARDINAVILFGTEFGEVLQSTQTIDLCGKFKAVPKNRDYLAAKVSSLKTLYSENGSLTDQKQVTATGLQWNRSKHLFEPCPPAETESKGLISNLCYCERIQEFVPKGAIGSIRHPGRLPDHGAVIFGRGTSSWLNGLGKSLSYVQDTPQKQDAKLGVQSVSSLLASSQNREGHELHAHRMCSMVEPRCHPPFHEKYGPTKGLVTPSADKKTARSSTTAVKPVTLSKGSSQQSSVLSTDNTIFSTGGHSNTGTTDSDFSTSANFRNSTSDKPHRARPFKPVSPVAEVMISRAVNHQREESQSRLPRATQQQRLTQHRNIPPPSKDTIEASPIHRRSLLPERIVCVPLTQLGIESSNRPNSPLKFTHSQQGLDSQEECHTLNPRVHPSSWDANNSIISTTTASNSRASSVASGYPALHRKPGFQYPKTSAQYFGVP